MTEPKVVAWIHFFKNGGFQITPIKKYPQDFPLYFSSQQKEWQGLTDEEYETMAEQHVTNCYFDTLKYAKAIEAKLKEKNNG
jgi:hypothetical protein